MPETRGGNRFEISTRRVESPTIVPDRSGATGDAELARIWIATKRSKYTQKAYAYDAKSLLDFLHRKNIQLREMTVLDMQEWVEQLSGAPASRSRKLGAIRSLLSFGQRTGYLQFNVGAVIQPIQVPNDLSERIIDEAQTAALLQASTKLPIVRFLYASGARVSEACGVCCGEVHEAPGDAATVTLHGKGGKTRHVVVPPSVAEELFRLREGHEDKDPLFRSRSGHALHPVNVAKQVRRAAKRAGLKKHVSPHWLRHAHASHALDHQASPVLVRDNLGHASLATTSKYAHARPGDGSGLYLPLLKR